MTMPRCSRIDWVPVLTSEEIEFLDKVKTTQRQAAQILRRNTALLRLLDFGTSGTVYIGCPRCASSRYVAGRRGCACCSVCVPGQWPEGWSSVPLVADAAVCLSFLEECAPGIRMAWHIALTMLGFIRMPERRRLRLFVDISSGRSACWE